jgi:hypothetical protein
LRGHELLDTFGGPVEARGKVCDLVTAMHLDPCLQVSCAKLFDTCAQPFQAVGNTTCEWICANRNRQREQRDPPQPGKVAVWPTHVRVEPAPVGQVQRHRPTRAMRV